MKRGISHFRSNAIAYLALFVALGGTSYAAISIPRNSVGTRQLRNGAVTVKKLDPHSIPGYVAFWARIYNTGRVLASSAPAKTEGWGGVAGNIVFHGVLPRNCFPLANATVAGSVSNVRSTSFSGQTEISVAFGNNGVSGSLPGPIAVDVAEICP